VGLNLLVFCLRDFKSLSCASDGQRLSTGLCDCYSSEHESTAKVTAVALKGKSVEGISSVVRCRKGSAFRRRVVDDIGRRNPILSELHNLRPFVRRFPLRNMYETVSDRIHM